MKNISDIYKSKLIRRNIYSHFYENNLYIKQNENVFVYLSKRANEFKQWSVEHNCPHYNDIAKSYEICLSTIKDLGITEAEVLVIASVASSDRNKRYKYKFGKTKFIFRDNRSERNITDGYGGMNSIRYPKKKRSLKQWSNFYKLFPKLAIKDNWDGKTSDKMK